MSQSSTDKGIHKHHHAVQFYGNEKSLFATVAGFLGEGLIAGEPAIVIATESHRVAILEHLSARLIDCDAAQRTGKMLLLDAEETLDQFMIGDAPDPDLFERTVGSVIQELVDGPGQPLIRAYGEMVDVLWKDGRTEAAIKLEILWNKLALKHTFALLCGYAMGNFYKQAKQMNDVCAQHTQVSHEATLIPFRRKRARRPA
jgi:hypothetical protein